MPQLLSDDQIRIGVVSGYLYLHSNWKIPIRGWVENLDKQRFSLYGYYTGRTKDGATAIARQCFHRFIEDVYSLDELCQIIRNDNLHILIFPEIGMDPMTVKLASLRLAPVQCVSWGHPDTSGLPTLDYYLSSDLMEPHDANDHYTEQLIRLPHLSIFYSPADIPTVDATRKAFNLRQNSTLYLCCQSLFKYLPQYDEIYPQIAREVGDCAFLFISYHKSDYVTEQFRLRVRKAFEQYGMSADEHVILLPRLDPARYHALNHISDIFLDSIGWSGCNTTLEAITCNLPIVTFSGKLMRGRHSAAILNMMGIKETIAESVNEYIEMAVRLGKDAEFRKYLSDKIAENKHSIYRDRTCITGLEDFLEKAVRERLE